MCMCVCVSVLLDSVQDTWNVRHVMNSYVSAHPTQCVNNSESESHTEAVLFSVHTSARTP